MSYSARNITFLYGDLISGSTDPLRTQLGGFWQEVSSSESGVSMSYRKFNMNRPRCNWISEVIENTEEIQPRSTSTLMPNIKFPIRIAGDGEMVEDDDDWASRIGAAVNTNEKIFLHTSYANAYPDYQATVLSEQGVTVDKVDITYEYNGFLPEYQQYIMDMQETRIPDINLLTDLSTYDLEGSDGDLFPSDILNVATLNGEYKNLDSLFTLNSYALRSDMEIRRPEELEALTGTKEAYAYSFLRTEYLTGALPKKFHNANSADIVSMQYGNVLFDYDIIKKLYIDGDIERNKEFFPYYAKVSIPLDDVGEFHDAIKENNYSATLINDLAKAFRYRNSKVKIQSLDVKLLSEGYSVPTMNPRKFADDEARTDTTYSIVNRATDYTVRMVDYAKLLLNSSNNVPTSPGNQMHMGQNNPYRSGHGNSNNGYSYVNTIASDGMISHLVSHVSSSSNFNVSSIKDLYSNQSSENETIAYRIEKTSTSGIHQNFWIMNYDMQDYNFYDTQIRYGDSYTYKIYAYRIMQGFRYQYSDVMTTKQLGCDDGERYGLEFNRNGERVDQLLNTEGGRAQKLNEYVSMAQLTSLHPYLADMYVTCEPFLGICELPVVTKNITITDNWPARARARPYHILDQSQTIGFEIYSGDHFATTYGTVLNSAEQQNKANYLFSKNIMGSQNVDYETVSTQDFVQVYRLSTKPTSMTDFADALIATVNLKQQNNKFPYKTAFYENIIKTNKKYYYLFRTLNEQGVIGHLSEVYQVELVDDGGYIYSVFKAIKENDLPEKRPLRTSVAVKKLLQFTPAIQHTELDIDSVDTTQNAGSQVEQLKVGFAEDPIWDKTFKIRLTSKKTDKKLDLNITYKLESEY